MKSDEDAILLWNAAANALEAKDAEIAKQRAMMHSQDEALADAQDKRDKYYADWHAEHRRVEAGDKRQDALEAEIEQLRNELALFEQTHDDDYALLMQMIADRDEAIAKLDKTNRINENLLVRLKQAIEHRDMWYKRTMETVDLLNEARAWARKLYQDNQLKDGDIIRLCEELDKRPILKIARALYQERDA
jgi:chromosome segregation ATPase